eukprot:22504-Chlamydomonas_euryale.AAC.2
MSHLAAWRCRELARLTWHALPFGMANARPAPLFGDAALPALARLEMRILRMVDTQSHLFLIPPYSYPSPQPTPSLPSPQAPPARLHAR